METNLRITTVFLFVLFLVTNSEARIIKSAGSDEIAIINANVISMKSTKLLPNRTVIVKNGVVFKIQRSSKKLKIGKDAKVIDAKGQFLIPGLHDMHVHLETDTFAKAFGLDPTKIEIPFEDILFLYLANGVTNIRVLSGSPELLKLRRQVSAREKLGPQITLASPMIDGNPPILPEPFTRKVSTPDEAIEAVREFKASGYDLLKIRDGLSASVYKALIKEAQEQNFKVDGHLPRKLGNKIEPLLRSGQNGVAHIEVFCYFNPKLDDELVKRYTKIVREEKLEVTTTLTVFPSIIGQMENLSGMLKRDEVGYVFPLAKNLFWKESRNPYQAQSKPATIKRFKRYFEFQKKLVKSFYDAGVSLYAGSDALNPVIVPGFSLHDELELLVEAGLTPYQALTTATVNPTKHLKTLKNGGRIAKRKNADFVLLKKNPLEKISNTRQISGVMIRGKWISESEIKNRMDVIRMRFQK